MVVDAVAADIGIKIVASHAHYPGVPYRTSDLLEILQSDDDFPLEVTDAFLEGLGINSRNMLIDPSDPHSWWFHETGKYPFAQETARAYAALFEREGLAPLQERDKIILVTNTPDMIGPHAGYVLEHILRTSQPSLVLPRIVVLTGEGCSGYISALKEAQDFLKAYPKQRVVILTQEIMTPLAWNPQLGNQVLSQGSLQQRKGLAIQKLLFGDGCTASLIVHEDDLREGLTFKTFGRWSNLEPQDLHLLEGIGHGTQGGVPYPPQGFFSQQPRKLFERLSQAYLPLALEFTREAKGEAAHYAIHTGSAKILDFVQWGMGISDAQTLPSRSLLARQGNMNSSTGAAILEQQLRESPNSSVLALFFGVGFALQVAF